MYAYLMGLGICLGLLLGLVWFCRQRIRHSEQELAARIQYRVETIIQASQLPAE